MTMSNPPALPHALLPLLVRVDAREAVCGDLLEEYREARVPALGRRRADLWYWRQVAGVWLRAYWWLAVPFALVLGIHDLFNSFRAPSGASYLDGLPALVRVPISPLAGVGVFALAGACGSWRTRQWEGGLVAALGTFCVTWLFMLVWWNATFYPFAQAQQSNPYWIEAWQWSTHRAHSDDTFFRWIFWDNVGSLLIGGIAMLTMSVVCGGLGSGVALCVKRITKA